MLLLFTHSDAFFIRFIALPHCIDMATAWRSSARPSFHPVSSLIGSSIYAEGINELDGLSILRPVITMIVVFKSKQKLTF